MSMKTKTGCKKSLRVSHASLNRIDNNSGINDMRIMSAKKFRAKLRKRAKDKRNKSNQKKIVPKQIEAKPTA